MNSWFRSSIANSDTMHLWYDPECREINITDNTDDWTMIYNEITDAFIGQSDMQPIYVINYNDKILSTIDGNRFYKHNSSTAHKCNFYGTQYHAYITLLINPSSDSISTYNNFEWLMEATDTNGVDIAKTFTGLTLWNDYQHSGVLTLVVDDNVKRRMRKWRYTIPRVIYKRDGITTQKERDGIVVKRDARFKDSHLFAKFDITNASDEKFIIHDITTSYTPSNK